MNNDRRKTISILINQLIDLKSQLESILNDEQEYFDMMPESFQNAEKGEKAQSAIENIETADSDLQYVIDALESAAE